MSLTPLILLRQELSARNITFARAHNLPHSCSCGETPTIAYHPVEDSHGNFLRTTYRAILSSPEWRQRLYKVHTQQKCFPSTGHRHRELDCSVSSDALLLNVFCYPGTLRHKGLQTFLGIEGGDRPVFGYRPRVPLISGRTDRTEIDMRIGPLLVESKLTESDFQRAAKERVHDYRDFNIFEASELPQTQTEYLGYQLIRNILAAFAANCSFVLMADQRRPDLIEQYYSVVRSIKFSDLRCRCRLLLWQELSSHLPKTLRRFLDEKYGISG